MKNTQNAKLVLQDGSIYRGTAFGYQGSAAGEVVFNTAMTGYPENLTDPSYKGQILISTYPLVGNYGVPGNAVENGVLAHYESSKVQVSGFIIQEYSFDYSHWNAVISLDEWLKQHNVPGIYGLDTRALTKKLREHGSLLGKIIIDEQDLDFYDPNADNLVAQVSIPRKEIYGDGKYKILLVDCGVKNNIIRCLLSRDATVIRVPWNHDLSREEFGGIFLSNGPGDPQMCTELINNIKPFLHTETPVFGICLGSQIMGLAAGADTYKLKYGHRGHNQPVQKAGTHQCFITTQNHGYVVDEETLPEDWEPLFVNLNDGSCEGIQHKTKPFFATQFHPEASGGPQDTEFLFDEFMEFVKSRK